MKINFRADTELRKWFNDSDGYNGRMKNKSAATLTNAELKALWDADHPDDPLEI